MTGAFLVSSLRTLMPDEGRRSDRYDMTGAFLVSRYGRSSYRAQCALLLTAFVELEPLCRTEDDLTHAQLSR